MDGKNSLNKRSVGSIAVAALLLMGIVAIAPRLTNSAYAQTGTTITTSADAHGGKFFGPALLEVLINVPSHASDPSLGTLPVRVTAFGASNNYQLGETGPTSGLFLLYIKVVPNATRVNPIIPSTPFSTTYTRLYIGPNGVANQYNSTAPNQGVKAELATSNVVKGGSVQISANGVSKTITWDESGATLTLDRTAYGVGSTIIAQINDQDANLDPTKVDIIHETVRNTMLVAGGDAPSKPQTFVETGPNTGIFELANLTTAALDPGIDSIARSLTANDYQAFEETTDGGLITPNATSYTKVVTAGVKGTTSASYTVQNVRGQFLPMPQPTYSTGLPLRVDDLDKNTNSRSQQFYTGPILVTVSNQAPNSLGGQQNPLNYNLREQNLDSNIFVPDYPGDQIKIVPGSPSSITRSDQTSGLLKVQPGNTITISYNDDGTYSTISFDITHTAATLAVNKATATQGSILTYTMTNPDLNNDPNVIESYTVKFDNSTNYNTDTAKPKVMSNWNAPLFDARIRVSGAIQTLKTPFSLTFIETGPNTGVFTAQLNLKTFATAVVSPFKFTDGDNIQLSIKDVMDQSLSVFPEATATTTLGLGKPTITLDRTTLGSPRDSSKASASDSGITVTGAFANLGPQVIHVNITDPSANTDAQSQETLIPSGTFQTNANGVLVLDQNGTSNDNDHGKLRISLLKSDGTAFVGVDTITVSKAFRETGLDTGIFTGEIKVNSEPTDTPAQWIGSKIKLEYAGQDNTFGTGDDADPVSASFTARNAILQTNSTVVATGKSITITVRDDDANRDTATAEQVRVGLRYTDNAGIMQYTSTTLVETGPNTGIFTKTLNIGTSVVGGKTLTIQPDTDFRIRYYDLTPNIPSASSWPGASSSQTQHDLILRTTVATGGLTLTPTVVGPATQIKVTVTDSDLNTNPQTKQTVTGLVTVVSDRGAASRADLNIVETGPNTGIFEGKVRLNPSQTADAANTPSNDVTINVLPGDIVSIRYEDQHGVNGQRTTISKTVQVVSVDPMMNFSKTSYAVGDTLMLTIDDPDANRDPDTADILTLRATSTTDPVGLTNVQAIETGPNTGVFQAIILTSSTFSTGALQVNNGDTVTVEYVDQFPANFRQKFDQTGTLAGSSQKFRITTTIGGGGTPNTAAHTTPGLFNLDGSSVTAVTTGKQVAVGTTVKNNDSQTRTMTVLVEVRDADGITVMTGWQTITLGANGSTNDSTNIGISWLPENAGSYQVRTFVVSGLTNPQAYSDVVTSNITVS